MFGTLSTSGFSVAPKNQPSPLKQKTSPTPRFQGLDVHKDSFPFDMATVNRCLEQMRVRSLEEELPPTAGSPREMMDSPVDLTSVNDRFEKIARKAETEKDSAPVNGHQDQNGLPFNFEAIVQRCLSNLQSRKTAKAAKDAPAARSPRETMDSPNGAVATNGHLGQTTPAVESAADQSLLAVIKNKDNTAINQALEAGVDVNQADSKGWTPLMQIAHGKYENNLHDLVIRVLAHNPDLDLQNESGGTALMESVKADNMFVTRRLLRHPQNLDIQDKDGNTALNHAALMGDRETTALLLDAGANPDIPDHDGVRPIDRAIEFWDYPMFETLSKGGEGRDNGASFAHALERLGNTEDPAAAREHSTGLLAAGLNVLKPDELKQVLAHNPELNIPEEADEYVRNSQTNRRNGGTLLMRAAASGNLDAVKQLTEAGADVLQTDLTGATALQYVHRKKNCMNPSGLEKEAALKYLERKERYLKIHEFLKEAETQKKASRQAQTEQGL